MGLTKQQELMQTIFSRAWKDDAFKNELIVKPTETIEKLTNKKLKLPKGTVIMVQDQTDEGTIYINIPSKFNLGEMELSEDQLEAIAGGAPVPQPKPKETLWDKIVDFLI